MRELLGMTAIALALLTACSREAPDPTLHGSASTRLKPVSGPLSGLALRRTVYVPVYSSIYLGVEVKRDMVELAATVSVRNISPRYPLVVNYVRYYDSAGKQIREYVRTPSELAPLATVEFVVQERDSAGGPGANFLVQWAGPADIDEPLIEAVMVGRSGDAGISFTSTGRALRNEPPQ